MPDYYVAVDVGATKTKGALFGADLGLVTSASRATSFSDGMQSVVRGAIDLIDTLLRDTALSSSDLRAIGIGAFGFVDYSRSVGIKTWRVDASDYPIGDPIHQRFGVPVYVDNDGHVAVMGERYFGAAQGYADVLQLGIGTGLAAGVISGGSLLVGTSNLAAEIGHFGVHPHAGPICICGRRGCAQLYISATAMVQAARALLNAGAGSTLRDYALNSITAEHIGIAASSGDALAVQVLDGLVDNLSKLLASLMIVFNPALVLIGGGVSRLGDALLEPLSSRVSLQLMHPRQGAPIRQAALGDRSGVYGALALAVFDGRRPTSGVDLDAVITSARARPQL